MCNLRTLQRYEEAKEGWKGPHIELLLKMMSCYQCELSDLTPDPDLSQTSDRDPPLESV